MAAPYPGHEGYHQHQHHAPPPHEFRPQGQMVKIITKVDKTFNLGVRNGQPVLVPADSEDPTQVWWKDTSYGERTKDNYGTPAFALLNNANRMVLKHGKEKGHHVFMVAHQGGANVLDEDILWSESQDFGEGFTTLRMASDTLLNMTALVEKEKKSVFHHEKPVHLKEGTPVLLDTWHEADSQLWKVFPL